MNASVGSSQLPCQRHRVDNSNSAPQNKIDVLNAAAGHLEDARYELIRRPMSKKETQQMLKLIDKVLRDVDALIDKCQKR